MTTPTCIAPAFDGRDALPPRAARDVATRARATPPDRNTRPRQERIGLALAEPAATEATAQIARHPRDDSEFQPFRQVLTCVTHDMEARREARFVPLVGIMSVAHEDGALQPMNGSRHGRTVRSRSRDTGGASRISDRPKSHHPRKVMT